jgi:hypothetical protein
MWIVETEDAELKMLNSLVQGRIHAGHNHGHSIIVQTTGGDQTADWLRQYGPALLA